tara:strand:- start:12932 stop:14233 length:1302 start_codon:yes stop_codon:yes gene_type:complete
MAFRFGDTTRSVKNLLGRSKSRDKDNMEFNINSGLGNTRILEVGENTLSHVAPIISRSAKPREFLNYFGESGSIIMVGRQSAANNIDRPIIGINTENVQVIPNASTSEKLHIQGEITFSNWANSTTGPELNFKKSKGGSFGTHGAVTNNTHLGEINFYGSDGDTPEYGARIVAQATETWSDSQQGTELQFFITKSGATADTEVMTLTQNGIVEMPTLGGLIVQEHIWVPSTKEAITFSATENWEYVSDKAKLTWTQPLSSENICIEVEVILAGTPTTGSDTVPIFLGLVGGVSSATGSGTGGTTWANWGGSDYSASTDGSNVLKKENVNLADVFDEGTGGDATNNGRMSSQRVFQPDDYDDNRCYVSFYYTGLTEGTSYTVFLATKANTNEEYQVLAGCEQNMSNSAENYAPIVMRARTLPSSFSTVITASNT